MSAFQWIERIILAGIRGKAQYAQTGFYKGRTATDQTLYLVVSDIETAFHCKQMFQSIVI